jgi:hypothetical protein
VRLGDRAWGNGNWDPSGAWDDRYPTTLVNSRTVSIEHHDNGGRTAGSGKGVVPEAVIAASIALDALLLHGDLAELKAAGIRFRAGTEASISREFRAIPVDRHHLIDHHYISGRLKPSCWRPWADDPTGFPQARYLAALTPGAASAGGDREQLPRAQGPLHRQRARGHLAVRELRGRTLARQHLCRPRARHALSRPAASTVRIVEYVDAKGVHTGRAMFAKASEVTTIRPAPDPTPFSQAQLDAAKKAAAAAVKAAADRAAAAYGA